MINGSTKVIAHLGYPTEAFRAPLIYNPWFERSGIDAVVVPMGVKPDVYPSTLRAIFQITNVHGALVTMPHKMSTVALVDHVTDAVAVAGSCNAILRRPDGSLLGDLFDGIGFVRAVERRNRTISGARAMIVGNGGVGSAVAASLAAAGAAHLALLDIEPQASEALRGRLQGRYPEIEVTLGSNDPGGYDIVVNASTLGLNPDDPLPVDVSRLAPGVLAAEVLMTQSLTPFLRAARERGCEVQVGTEMLFEMIPAYLEFFGFGSARPEELRAVSAVQD